MASVDLVNHALALLAKAICSRKKLRWVASLYVKLDLLHGFCSVGLRIACLVYKALARRFWGHVPQKVFENFPS